MRAEKMLGVLFKPPFDLQWVVKEKNTGFSAKRQLHVHWKVKAGNFHKTLKF
ncbi:hypothetical protein HMPREF3224_02169 [Anaerococcus hydrogenalis]|nr:hypothetical protein HMPREF3224_02169 [Anaerococcus hydrogenalis]